MWTVLEDIEIKQLSLRDSKPIKSFHAICSSYELFSLAHIKDMECLTIAMNDIWTGLKLYWLTKSNSDWKDKIQLCNSDMTNFF